MEFCVKHCLASVAHHVGYNVQYRMIDESTQPLDVASQGPILMHAQMSMGFYNVALAYCNVLLEEALSQASLIVTALI